MKNIRHIIACLFLIILAIIMLSGSLFPAPVKYSAGVVGFCLFIFYMFKDRKEEKSNAAPGAKTTGVVLDYELMPLAYAAFKSQTNCTIIATNTQFRAIFNDAVPSRMLTDFIPLDENDLLSIGNGCYHKILWESGGVAHLLLLPTPNDKKEHLPIAVDTNSMAVCNIFIDNYEEALESIEEPRRPILLAFIDRKLNAMSQDVGGILKKFERDRYLFLLSEGSLNKLKLKKFEILEQIREINMGNKLKVTLSIGIGIHGATLAQNQDFSRAALDLAVGRGGDQVLIKDSENYQFYGGISSGVERTSNVRARVKATALLELMHESTQIFIMGHKNPDMDSFGSAIGICHMAKSTGKQPVIILDTITSNIKRMYEQVIEDDDYYKDHILNCEQALPLISNTALLIVVDTHSPSYCSSKEALLKTDKIVVIDHHRLSTQSIDKAVLTYHEPYASSASELVTEMLQYINKHPPLRPVAADCLLAGVTVDTKYFTIKTGAKTFEAAAYLRRNGADAIRVRVALQNDMLSFVAKALAVSDSELFLENIAISKCVEDTVNPALTAAQAADELLNIEGIQASFVLARVEDKILISARSLGLGGINVQRVMEKLGGGGHQTVAGAQISAQDFDTVIERVKQSIIEFMEEENA